MYCPKDIKVPVLPHKVDGKTIFPTGTWRGVYFSEELKAVIPLGYKIKPVGTAYEYSKIDLFSVYVDHFYEIKKIVVEQEDGLLKCTLISYTGILVEKEIYYLQLL